MKANRTTKQISANGTRQLLPFLRLIKEGEASPKEISQVFARVSFLQLKDAFIGYVYNGYGNVEEMFAYLEDDYAEALVTIGNDDHTCNFRFR